MKAKERTLSHQRLRDVLHYDPLTGLWIWLQHFFSNYVGQQAGSRRKDGYWTIKIFNEQHQGSRLAWFYMTGEWPSGEVDHEDTDCTNDRWANLRDVPGIVNSWNKRRPYRNNKSTGVLGVQRMPHGKFRAALRVRGQAMHLGNHGTLEEAAQAYKEAKAKHHATPSTHNKRRAFHG